MKMIVSCCMLAMLLLILPFQAESANLAIVTPQVPFITDGGVDTPYTFSFIASGGTGSYTWSRVSGPKILPPGLSLSTEGVLSGTPTSSGSYDFTVKVTDSAQATVSKQIFMNVTSMRIAMPTSHPDEYGNCTTCHGVPDLPPVTTITNKPAIITASTNATFSFSANKTVKKFEYSLDNADWTPLLCSPVACPPSTVKTVSFTGLELKPHIFRVRTTDDTLEENVEFPPASYNWTITTSLAITTESPLPSGTVGTPYNNLTLTAINGVSPFYWDGELPDDLSLDYETGVISGTPTTPGTYAMTFTVYASGDPLWPHAHKDFTITINDHPDLTITTTSLPSGTQGAEYDQPLSAAGGVQGYTWSLVSGSLPNGVGLFRDALTGESRITGTPDGYSVGTYTFVLGVTDTSIGGHNHSASRAFSIVIAPALTITTTSLSSATVGTPYSQAFSTLYGTAPYVWTKNGTLPDGLSLDSSSGVISGTPTQPPTGTLPRTYPDISLLVTDASGKTANKTFPGGIVLNNHSLLTITTESLPSGNVGSSYSQAVTATGGVPRYTEGVPSYTWTLYYGSLPTGLTINGATGAITGNPTAAGTYPITLNVEDEHRHYYRKTLSIVINPPMTITTASPLTSGIVGVSYSQTLTALYGATPYTWIHSDGTLPPGLTLNDGVLSGSPTTAGSYTFTLAVNDSGTQTASKSFTIVIHTALTITTSSLAPGIVGTSYSQTPAASGGVPPYTWFHTGGTLPPGVTINAGTLSGSPTTAGSYTFTLTVNDSSGQTASKACSIVINTALTVTTESLPSGTVGTSYSQASAASGGVTPYIWAHSSGTLPPGLTFNAGTLSGSPTTEGSYAFTLTVNDSSGLTAGKSFTVVINAATSSTPPITIPNQPGTYTSVTGAYTAVSDNGTINIATGDVTETLDFKRSIHFILKGGYNSASGTYSGTSTIIGTLTVSSGSLTVENIIIR